MPGSNIIKEMVVKFFLLLTKMLQLFRRRPQRETPIVNWAVEIAKAANIAHLLYWDPINIEECWFHY